MLSSRLRPAIGVCEGIECGNDITRSGVICLKLCVGFNVPLLESACFAACVQLTARFSMMLIGGIFPWLYLICGILFKAHF